MMSDISNEIASIAIANGYDGDTPRTVTEAIDALTVALGGEADSESVADAIKALAPNISGGGEGGGDSDGSVPPWSTEIVGFYPLFKTGNGDLVQNAPFLMSIYDGTFSIPQNPEQCFVYFSVCVYTPGVQQMLIPKDSKIALGAVTPNTSIATVYFTDANHEEEIVPEDLHIIEDEYGYRWLTFTIPDEIGSFEDSPVMHVIKAA